MRGILSFGITPTSMATTAKGNLATSRGGMDRGRHEEGGVEGRLLPRQLEQPYVHVGLGLDPLEMDGEDILGLVALGNLRDALPLESLLGLDALLRQGQTEGVTHPDAEPARPGQAVHQLLD